jgi:hypothetical protein
MLRELLVSEAALTAVVDASSIAVSCNVISHRQASGRSLVSRKLCSSVEVNPVEISMNPLHVS